VNLAGSGLELVEVFYKAERRDVIQGLIFYIHDVYRCGSTGKKSFQKVVWRHLEQTGGAMTKVDIFEKIQKGTGMTKKESAEMVEEVFSLMKNILESGENLKISGFGSFIVKQKADRRGRNPQTGEAMTIEARRIVTFKPSGLLRKQINKEISP
jgi:integration host factor subunit alpha